jgi:hypothetical protein
MLVVAGVPADYISIDRIVVIQVDTDALKEIDYSC